MLWGDWNVCVIESPRSSLDKRRIFRKTTLNGLYTPLVPPFVGDRNPQGREDVTALLGAQNRYAIRLAGHHCPRHDCAGWDRLDEGGDVWGWLSVRRFCGFGIRN